VGDAFFWGKSNCHWRRERSGRPVTSRTEENIEKVNQIVRENLRPTVQEHRGANEHRQTNSYNCVWDALEGASPLDSDVDGNVVSRKLWNIRWEPKSPCRRCRWTHRAVLPLSFVHWSYNIHIETVKRSSWVWGSHRDDWEKCSLVVRRDPYVSKEHIASIFSVKETSKTWC
jgi:hypothetical protein